MILTVALSLLPASSLWSVVHTRLVRCFRRLDSSGRRRREAQDLSTKSELAEEILPSQSAFVLVKADHDKMALDQAAYDALTPEQQRAHDESERKREADVQAALPYKWTQALDHVHLTLDLEPGTRAKALDISIKRSSLRVAKKDGDKAVLLQGDLPYEIKIDDSTWSVEDAKLLSVHLEKSNSSQWWPHVFTHDPKIDTTKLVPENSKLSDLDGETRAMVEKMMHDNRAKQLGQPTSDEARQQEILKNFQKQHPEMDFSQAKIGGGGAAGAFGLGQ